MISALRKWSLKKLEYKILVSFNLEKVLPSVDSIVSEINQHMQDFGFEEKLTLRSGKIHFATLTVSEEISLETVVQLQEDYRKILLEKFPDSRPEVEILR